jgi:hypothetical protein
MIKQAGLGALVLVPTILAFISMSFALSTIPELNEKPYFYMAGGILWALIIFAFDRFIVSTHRRKTSDTEELKSPVFYLRLGFALLLGIVISHPLVMLYFKGSIEDQLAENVRAQKTLIHDNYEHKIHKKEAKMAFYDSLYLQKERQRDEQALVVAKEIDGEVLKDKSGQLLTTGLSGKGTSAENKIGQLRLLQSELTNLKQTKDSLQGELRSEIALLEEKRDSTQAAFTLSSDYLQRELAFEQLKEKHAIVSVTQWLLITLFVLVDILPFIFKTFAPYGLYDKIISEYAEMVREVDTRRREQYIQQLYNKVSE